MHLFTNKSIDENNSSSNFKPSKLPTRVLDQLHQIAVAKGKKDLSQAIEREIFDREKERVEKQDEVIRWYEMEKEKLRGEEGI